MVQLGEKDQGCKMILGLKRIPKQVSLCYKKLSMSKIKCNFKNTFRDFEELSLLYSNFKNKLDKLKRKSYLVAVSGGPDSLALAALSKA